MCDFHKDSNKDLKELIALANEVSAPQAECDHVLGIYYPRFDYTSDTIKVSDNWIPRNNTRWDKYNYCPDYEVKL